jgi:ComF family protein
MVKEFLQYFFPNNCPGCHQPFLTGESMICFACRASLPKTGYHHLKDNPVAKTFWGKVNVYAATAVFYFDKGETLQKLLHQLKYKGNKEVGIAMGKWMAEELQESEDFKNVECVIPVPLHKNKLRMRGYNQSEMIAQGIAEKWNIALQKDLLIRKKNTETQTRKNRFDRFKNVDNVFDIENKQAYENKHILLVDDVITTGSTIAACVEKFETIRACKISVAAVACAHS